MAWFPFWYGFVLLIIVSGFFTEGGVKKNGLNPLSQSLTALPAPPKGELFAIFWLARIKLSLRGKTSPAPGEDVTAGDKRGNLARERLRGF